MRDKTQGKLEKKCLLTQEVAPRAVPKVPEVHGKQLVIELAPRAVEKVPAPHAVHDEAALLEE